MRYGMENIMVEARAKERSRGISIFGMIEVISGVGTLLNGTVCLAGGLVMYKPHTTNISVGVAFFLAAMSFLVGSALLAGGRLLLALRPAGRIINICLMILLLPISIPLLIYLFMPDVKKQFTNTDKVKNNR